MKILLTAFDPFGGEKINPALEAVKAVSSQIGTTEVMKLEVPTVFYRSIDTVMAAVKDLQPDAVLCVGQAGGRFGVTPERVAININDARIPDNEGNQPIDTPVYEDGQAAYFTTLPVKAMTEAIKSQGLPSSVSNSAGTFVCNHLMYGVLYHLDKEYPKIRGGFVHVPFIPSQVVDKANAPAMSIPDITAALEACIRAIEANKEDIVAAGGKEH